MYIWLRVLSSLVAGFSSSDVHSAGVLLSFNKLVMLLISSCPQGKRVPDLEVLRQAQPI